MLDQKTGTKDEGSGFDLGLCYVVVVNDCLHRQYFRNPASIPLSRNDLTAFSKCGTTSTYPFPSSFLFFLHHSFPLNMHGQVIF